MAIRSKIGNTLRADFDNTSCVLVILFSQDNVTFVKEWDGDDAVQIAIDTFERNIRKIDQSVRSHKDGNDRA